MGGRGRRRGEPGHLRGRGRFGELVFNCTAGTGSLEALGAAGEENLSGKVLVDVSNPLDFSKGMPPTLSVCNDDSARRADPAQRFPEAKVVKTLNTMNAAVMVDPASVPGEHDVFVCGNDDGAKAQVSELLQSFGWPAERIIDLGDITAARGPEMYLPLWLRLMGAVGPAVQHQGRSNRPWHGGPVEARTSAVVI